MVPRARERRSSPSILDLEYVVVRHEWPLVLVVGGSVCKGDDAGRTEDQTVRADSDWVPPMAHQSSSEIKSDASVMVLELTITDSDKLWTISTGHKCQRKATTLDQAGRHTLEVHDGRVDVSEMIVEVANLGAVQDVSPLGPGSLSPRATRFVALEVDDFSGSEIFSLAYEREAAERKELLTRCETARKRACHLVCFKESEETELT